MSVFADSSAVVKLYVDEPGAEGVRALDVVAVSALARVEVPAALWRKMRTGDLQPGHVSVLVNEFEADWYGEAPGGEPRFAVLTVSGAVLEDAARLAAGHGLRAYDAVQLASGTAARAADPGVQRFACFDGSLRVAAAAEGFRLLPA